MAAPAIGVRNGWQPGLSARVDWSHPLAAGMAHCFLWDGGSWTDVVTGVRMTRQSTGPTNGVTPGGRGGTIAGNLGGAWAIVPPVTYPSSWTWVGTVPANFTSNFGMLFAHIVGSPDDTTENEPYVSGIASLGSTTQPRAVAGHGLSSFVQFNSTEALAVGRFGVVSVVAGTSAQSIWVNGLSGGTASVAMTNPNMTSFQAYVSFGSYISSAHAASTSVAGIYHRRELAPAEIAALHADPFQMLRR